MSDLNPVCQPTRTATGRPNVDPQNYEKRAPLDSAILRIFVYLWYIPIYGTIYPGSIHLFQSHLNRISQIGLPYTAGKSINNCITSCSATAAACIAPSGLICPIVFFYMHVYVCKASTKIGYKYYNTWYTWMVCAKNWLWSLLRTYGNMPNQFLSTTCMT